MSMASGMSMYSFKKQQSTAIGDTWNASALQGLLPFLN
jgi:hypothetical protein